MVGLAEALKTFDWGTDLAVVAPIEEAVTAAHGKPDLSHDLENRLVAALKGEISRDGLERGRGESSARPATERRRCLFV